MLNFLHKQTANVALNISSDYASNMKAVKTAYPVFSFLLAISFPLHAGFYKGLDEKGNVVYSDKPFTNSEKIVAPSISVMDAPKVKPAEKKQPDAGTDKNTGNKVVKYSRLAITAPKNQETLWNNKALSVTVSLSPALNIKGGDYLSLKMDGKTVVKHSNSLQLQLGTLERGEHKLQVLVRNKQGKVVKRSKAITVHIKHSVVRKQPKAG